MRKRRNPLLLPLLFFIACRALPAQAQQISYHRVEQSTIEERLKTSSSRNSERRARLHQLFEEAGCKGYFLNEPPVKGSAQPNVVCRLPGSTETEIIVGAHFDQVETGQGVVDNWSGASLLPSLFESLQAEPHRHTFVFIGFTDEEKGLVGSEQYVKELTPWERSKIRAMVRSESTRLNSSHIQKSRMPSSA